MMKFSDSKKTAFFILFSIILNINGKAQIVDTLKSEQIYLMLDSCSFERTIIDGRDSSKFYTGHIKNAVYIDAFSDEVMPFLENYINNDTLFVYCTNQTRAEIIIENLLKLKYKGRIIYMQDGLNGWKNSGYTLEIPKTDNK